MRFNGFMMEGGSLRYWDVRGGQKPPGLGGKVVGNNPRTVAVLLLCERRERKREKMSFGLSCVLMTNKSPTWLSSYPVKPPF